MSIEFRCSHCHKLLRVPDDSGGRQAQCPNCGALETVPAPGAQGANPFGAMPAASVPEMPAPDPAAEWSQNPYQSPQSAWAPPPVAAPSQDGRAVASLVLGIFSLAMLLCCLPVGFVCSLIGLPMGFLSLNTPSRGMAIGGIVMNAITFLLGLAYFVFVVIMLVSGHLR